MSIFPSWTTEQKYPDEHKLNLGADMANEILLDIHDRVANITFNRPDQHNAIAYEGWLRLIDIVNQIKLDPDIRVVVFTGAGSRSFSAGADIKDFDSHRYDSASSKVYSEAFDGALDEIETLSMPTISKIRGICVGGGCELSMATDIRIASEDSKFGIPVAKLGILVGYREM
ncbi:MAG TPA: enoyl-CoA hydratase/isomerase family protein, partial [Dehalococcoidia bacterium]|nr:enoyl-CoA hydratase/isomerase family protein [Dehalococcoidia bacterium]